MLCSSGYEQYCLLGRQQVPQSASNAPGRHTRDVATEITRIVFASFARQSDDPSVRASVRGLRAVYCPHIALRFVKADVSIHAQAEDAQTKSANALDSM